MSGRVEIDVNAYSYIVIGSSIIIDFWRSRALYRVARKYNSQALEADALHFQTDIYSSIVVIVGLASVQLGFLPGDAISASCVAIIVIWISIRLGKRTIDVLLDRMPEGMDSRISRIVAKVAGVEQIRSLRIRESGSKTFIEIVIGIHRLSIFDQVHRIMDSVEGEVTRAIPRSEIIVHAEPVIGPAERLTDSVSWLVQQSGLAAHNVVILNTGGRYHVQLDIEYPPGTSFEQAHAKASEVEQRIRDELQGIDRVHVHLEEQASDAIETLRVTDAEDQLVSQIRETVASAARVKGCGPIECYKSIRGLKVSVQCSLDKELSLKETHSVVSKIELSISRLDQRIVKVFIHAEPA